MLVKLNKSGEILWANHFGSDYKEFGREIKQTYDKGFVIVGSSGYSPSDGSDVYLVKTDSVGSLIWENTYDILEYDAGYSVIQTIDSGFVITGEARISDGYHTYSHLFVMKINQNGENEWQKVFYNNLEGGKSIIQANDGNYFLCGFTRREGDKWSNLLIMKLDTEGDSIWSKNYGSQKKEFGIDIKQLNSNDLIICGYIGDTNNNDNVNSYFIKADLNGDTIWTRTFNSPGYDISTSVEITNDNAFVFVGYGEVKEVNNNDVYLLKMNQNGDTVWKKVFGGPTSEYGLDVKQTIDNGFIICGIVFGYDTASPYERGIYNKDG